MEGLDLISIGDSSLDVFIIPSESETLCQINDKESLVCFSYGDKIPVENLEFSVGGNAANNAVGTKRLGLNVALVSSLGDDGVGNQITDKLRSEGVDLTYLFSEKGTTSNYSTVINYSGERTIFTYHAKREYKFPENFPTSKWIYLTSMGEEFKPFYDKLVEWKKGYPEVKLAFNPGSRQLRAGTDAIRGVLEVSHVIYVNREEAEKITGMGSSYGKDRELLKALSALGPKISIVTDGGKGSLCFDSQSNKFYKAGVLPVDPFERTGAGDAFGSGCISALIKGKDFAEALLWGTLNSASVIGFIGAQKGLIKENEMPVWLERAKSSNVEVKEF